jgi:hypothetical protein
MFKRKTLVVAALILVLLLLVALRFGPSRWSAARLAVSPKTTFVTDHFRPDGYPDYIAALNGRMSDGVNSENNAAVLLVQALGVQDVPREWQAEFLGRMGLPPAIEPPRFVTWEKYSKTIPVAAPATTTTNGPPDPFEALLALIDRGIERPWRRDEFPPLAKWLEANAAGMELIVAASKRPRYYTPLVASGDPPTMIGVLLPLANDARQAALALVARAMLHLGEKEYQPAWEDLMACRRLGRVIGQGPFLVEALVGHAVEEIAIVGQIEFLAAAELPVDQWAALQADLDKLPALSPIADKLQYAERFSTLDLMLAIAEHGPKALQLLNGGNLENPLTRVALHGVDWNVPLAMANEWMDRVVAVAKIEDPTERARAAEQLENDIRALAADAKDPWGLAGAVVSRDRASEKVGEVILSLLSPSIAAMLNSRERLETRAELLRVGLALARYKAETGDYPSALAELEAKHLKTIPADAFAGTPFLYKKTANGYVLYSVGSNQKDEGGRSYDQQADDLTIEIPRPPRPTPALAENAEAIPAERAADDSLD